MRSLALLAALLVACGDDAQSMRDAATGDGGIDAPADADIDADPNVRGTVTVKIVDKNDAPIAGMYVVFIDTDATVTERMTDSAGEAKADVYPNATVTAVRQRSMSFAIVTVQALNPGDTIKLISASPTVTSSEDPFSQRVVPLPGADLAASPNGASKSGSTATYTTLAPHGLVVGDRVIVSNVTVAGYNGTWTVASVPTPTTFTANLGNSTALANSGTTAVGATAAKAVAFTVNYAAYAGAQNYQVHTRCSTLDVGNVTSAALVLPSGCATSPQDIEVLAKTNAGVTLAWTQQANVTLTAGGSTTIADSWHAPADLSLSYSNVTQEISQLTIDRFSPYMRGLPVAETMRTAGGTFALAGVSYPPRAYVASTFTCPEGSSATCLSTAIGSVAQRITQQVDGTATQHALDVGGNLLPWVKAAYVPATQTLDITVTGSGAYDIFEGNLRYTRMVAANQYIYTWRVFGPIAQSIKFPTLPPTAPGDPTVLGSDIMSSYQAFIGESDAINGYRAAIKSPFEALGTCEASTNVNVRSYGGMKNRISQWN